MPAVLFSDETPRAGDLGNEEKRETPKLTVRGHILEVETSKGKPTGTQAKRVVHAQLSSRFPRPPASGLGSSCLGK